MWGLVGWAPPSSITCSRPSRAILLVPGALPTAPSSGDPRSSSLFPQSLKSDEEAESTKEPQIELFEAQGKAWPVGGAPTGQ